MRTLIIIGGLILASVGQAQPCYYYWASDCFEIRDAARRDMVQHVLVSAAPREFDAAAGQCNSTAVEEHLDSDQKDKALKRFNKVLGHIDGCKRLSSLTPKVFSNGQDAYDSFHKLATERDFKKVHPVKRMPGP